MLDSKANTEKRKAGGRCMLSRLEKMREGCVKNAKVQDVITLVLSPFSGGGRVAARPFL